MKSFRKSSVLRAACIHFLSRLLGVPANIWNSCNCLPTNEQCCQVLHIMEKSISHTILCWSQMPGRFSGDCRSEIVVSKFKHNCHGQNLLLCPTTWSCAQLCRTDMYRLELTAVTPASVTLKLKFVFLCRSLDVLTAFFRVEFSCVACCC